MSIFVNEHKQLIIKILNALIPTEESEKKLLEYIQYMRYQANGLEILNLLYLILYIILIYIYYMKELINLKTIYYKYVCKFSEDDNLQKDLCIVANLNNVYY